MRRYATQGILLAASMAQHGRETETAVIQPVIVKRLRQEKVQQLNDTNPSVKKLAQTWRTYFAKEIDILLSCARHPNIVAILGYADNKTEFIMERAVGTLDLAVANASLERSRKYLKDVLTGVAFLHARGVSDLPRLSVLHFPVVCHMLLAHGGMPRR